MSVTRLCFYLFLLLAALTIGAYVFAIVSNAQTTSPEQLRPDTQRVAFAASQKPLDSHGRQGGYMPQRVAGKIEVRSADTNAARAVPAPGINRKGVQANLASAAISAGTALHRVLHTSQVSLTSSAGTDEELVDTNGNLIADQRQAFDNAGGSFDIAVGQSGARYEVYSATLQGTNVGVLVLALDTNGDYVVDARSAFDLHRDFSLPSAAAVVVGTSKSGKEFAIVSSSGYYN